MQRWPPHEASMRDLRDTCIKDAWHNAVMLAVYLYLRSMASGCVLFACRGPLTGASELALL